VRRHPSSPYAVKARDAKSNQSIALIDIPHRWRGIITIFLSIQRLPTTTRATRRDATSRETYAAHTHAPRGIAITSRARARRSATGARTQKHKNTKTQKHKNTKTQKHKNTKTQKHKTPKHQNTKTTQKIYTARDDAARDGNASQTTDAIDARTHTAPHENKNHTTPRILKWFPTQY
jgi:hypothetical protein